MKEEPEKTENDKPEKGEFFLIAHSVCDALIEVDELTKTQLRLIHYIIKQTWGWHKRFFLFSQKAACEKLKLDKSQISRAFNALRLADILSSQKGEFGINKYTDQWNLPLLRELNDGAKSKNKLQNPQQVAKSTTGKSCKNDNQKLQNPQLEVAKSTTQTTDKTPEDAITAIPINNSLNILNNGDTNTPYIPRSIDELFDEFWDAYPRHVKKSKALESFQKIKPSEDLFFKILDALERYKRSDQWTKDNGEFIPHPVTWLNQKRWEDDIPEPRSSNTNQIYATTDDAILEFLRKHGETA